MQISNYEILFILNPQEQIVLALYDPLQEIHCCYRGRIFFVQESESFTIFNDHIRHGMQRLRILLTAALQNELLLDPSINNNLGYLYAQYSFNCFDKNKAEQLGLIFDDQNNWVGRKYLLWAYNQVALWMYNDDKGSIILEFTPWYTGERYNEEYVSDYTEYEVFLAGYNPLFKRQLSPELAQQWLNQANNILQQIDDNITRAIKEKTVFKSKSSIFYTR